MEAAADSKADRGACVYTRSYLASPTHFTLPTLHGITMRGFLVSHREAASIGAGGGKAQHFRHELLMGLMHLRAMLESTSALLRKYQNQLKHTSGVSANWACTTIHCSAATVAVLIGGAIFFAALYLFLRSGPLTPKSYSPLRELRNGLIGDGSLGAAGCELDTERLDFEDESDGTTDGSEERDAAKRLRRVLGLSLSQRRRSSKESNAPVRPGPNLFRITSSDPRSHLSATAFEMDLDTRARVFTSQSQGAHPQRTSSVGSASSQIPYSVVRQRRESGRLTHSNGDAAHLSPSSASGKGSLTSKAASPSRAARPHRVGIGRAGATSPLQWERRVNEAKWSTRASLSDRDTDDGNSGAIRAPSPSSNSIASFASANSFSESIGLRSILLREPKFWTSLPSSSSSSSWVGEGHFGASPESDHTSDYTQSQPSSLPPGAGRPLFSLFAPAQPQPPRLGTLTAEQARAMWPEKRRRLVRVCEPDWMPYVDVHERARERIQTAELFSSNERQPPFENTNKIERSASPMPTSRRGWEGDAELGAEREFWFERFTQSTAAAGRDWDWRKRRARAASAAATEAAANIEAIDIDNGAQQPKETLQPTAKRKKARKHGQMASINRALTSLRTTSLTGPALNDEARTKNADGADAESTNEDGDRRRRVNSLPTDSAGISRERLAAPPIPKRAAMAPIVAANGTREGPAGSAEKSTPQEQQDYMSVPGRLANLKPKTVRNILDRRERSAALTAKLLQQAAEVDTDDGGDHSFDQGASEEDDDDFDDGKRPQGPVRDGIAEQASAEKGTQSNNGRTLGSLVSRMPHRPSNVRKAASSTQLDQANRQGAKLNGQTDGQGTGASAAQASSTQRDEAYSSAGAYGVSLRDSSDGKSNLFSRPSKDRGSVDSSALPPELAYLSGIFSEPIPPLASGLYNGFDLDTPSEQADEHGPRRPRPPLKPSSPPSPPSASSRKRVYRHHTETVSDREFTSPRPALLHTASSH